MIEIKNLRKEYKTSDDKQVALDDISFSLPNKGMVFVLGKSGSGKTTLMNLIGGLDSPTSGQIIVDGNKISSFSADLYEEYRNGHVGFVFQDFFLLENCTVLENVANSLILQNKYDEELVRKTLSIVDLAGLENRYPNEISGGQKQRVAIARAIVKNPQLILADEPTGNLDHRSASSILDLLKELSKDRLILIVSHNKEEAYKYADVLIKIDNGQVIDTYTKVNNDSGFINENNIIFPYNVKLKDDELSLINSYAKTGQYTLSQSTNRFTPGLIFDSIPNNIEIPKYKLNRKNNGYFSKKLQEGTKFQSIISSIVSAIMVVLLIVCFLFSTFDGVNIINHVNYFNQDNDFMLDKGYIDLNAGSQLVISKTVRVTDDDIKGIYDLGYEGNIYKVYTKSNILGTGVYTTRLDSGNYYKNSLKDIYSVEGRGVLDCDLDYLVNRYGIDGKLNVLAGSVEEGFKDNGFVITDYIADCMRRMYVEYVGLTKEEAYQKIVERQTYNNRFTVKAIIYTGYETRYPNVLEVYKLKENPALINQFNAELEKLQQTEEFYLFNNELESSLLLSYYIGTENFYDAILLEPTTTCQQVSFCHTYLDILGENKRNILFTERASQASDSLGLAVDEILVASSLYNEAFGTNVKDSNSADFKVEEIVITIYDEAGKTGGNVIYSKKLKIVGIYDTIGKVYTFHKDVYRELVEINVKPYAVVFDNTESITNIYDTENETLKTFYFSNDTYKYVYEIVDMLKVFKDLFFVMMILFTVGIIIIMSNSISKNVKRKTYDIGVLKGIGLKNKTVVNIFLKHLILLIGIMLTIITVALFFVEDLLNGILLFNLSQKMPSMLLDGMEVLKIDVVSVVLVYTFIVILSVLTTLILVSSLKKIKPIEIIKSKEL